MVRRPTPFLAAALVAVTLVAAGCGGGGERTGGPVDGSDALDDLPLMDEGRELTEAAESGDAPSRHFVLEMATPLDVLRFYRFELPRTGWEQISTADAVGGGALRGRWWRGDRLLEVRAGYASTAGTDVAAYHQAVEYSLVLRPVTKPSVAR